jgi:hypothetical protein
MAYIKILNPVIDDRGSLSVVESYKDIPFEIKRVFYIYDINKNLSRGSHRHKKTRMALICMNGSCVVSNNNGKEKNDFFLNSPTQCLILEPEDFHTMHSFDDNSIIMTIASEYYDPDDYIYEDYE